MFDRQLDVFGDEHDVAPAHERMRLFEPVRVMPGQTGMATDTPMVGDIWRDEDGQLVKVVHVDDKWVYVRHPNSKRPPIMTNPAWFARWTLSRRDA